jgi:aminopeptidase N
MRRWLLLIGLLLLSAVSVFAQTPYKGSYDILRRAEASKYNFENHGVVLFDSSHSYNVTHYNLRIDLNEESDNIRKSHVTVEAIANANLDSIDLHMVSMTVDSTKFNTNTAISRRRSGKLWVMTPQLAQGQAFTIDIFYHGFPSKGLFFTTTRHGDDHTYSSVEPSDSRYWWPCYDEPWDKATSDVYCTVGSGRTVVSNGNLVEVINEGSGRYTWHWHTDHQISTYLISIAVADYAIITDHAYVGDDTVPIKYYAYHQDSTIAAYDLGNTPDMVEFYSSRFINYGFADEKYAVVQSSIFNGWGAMEHQTCTTYGDELIDGQRSYEWIDAHELAHMWFGDLVTCGDWRNIWLNESFATYLDALYTEHKYGYSAFQQRRVEFFQSYSQEDQGFRYAIYNPPADYLFGSVEYEKGALVIHMLRRLLGDQNFFAALTNYLNDYHYGNGSTAELQQHFEVYYGNLDWFFNEWVYQAGHPVYRWTWWSQQIGQEYELNIGVRQIQTNAPSVFTMPITFKVHFASGADSTFQLWNNQQDQGFTIMSSRRPTNVYFDPENDLLKVADFYTGIDPQVQAPNTFNLNQNYPNPFNPSTKISFSTNQDGLVSLSVFDIRGALVKTLANGIYSAGNHQIIWDGTDDTGANVASGMYLYQLRSAEGMTTRKMSLIR